MTKLMMAKSWHTKWITPHVTGRKVPCSTCACVLPKGVWAVKRITGSFQGRGKSLLTRISCVDCGIRLLQAIMIDAASVIEQLDPSYVSYEVQTRSNDEPE